MRRGLDTAMPRVYGVYVCAYVCVDVILDCRIAG